MYIYIYIYIYIYAPGRPAGAVRLYVEEGLQRKCVYIIIIRKIIYNNHNSNDNNDNDNDNRPSP